MTRHLVVTFHVLNPSLPLEMEGVVDGYPFYYRYRGTTWFVYQHVTDHGFATNPPLAQGYDEDGNRLDVALRHILVTFEDRLDKYGVWIEAGK